ncbi:hypothetical protein PHYBLDRAFT_140508 [Phycomyces blakesleeanus NRRL 1555(-)]|uniref:Uncharacterized protein n=1 Tax=Phycomyces blakesleeanus (strain ATCC 8743b / DSM 1359 / FGSC 10004 / NBRC 33097 / NRRL 1555) TaxID=763407 RepID=A0A162UWB2_PHYB8|nr:hypothetical protein PHYBLDRAFT_140508 [Phycomyces blakesleeanus NRRL 1555(-)]OAD78423.1 hypothetical protein PHYBLDRAFT_140508 [Phycomyces blakesleeanus NRRL 1555(-)]|eukprot:XP_018296463.1 hypothetical protein PHYBLDRAFT_140508 [Phycomyces blakesleeanus NRRL 1555(-)]
MNMDLRKFMHVSLTYPSDISPMSFVNVSVDSEVDENFNEIDVEHESNENAEDIDDIKVEEVNTEYMFSNSSMPENHVHRFIATFIVLFEICYVITNNLPFSGWFKAENIILVGLLPGPKEPKTDEINNYLEPMVDEFVQLHRGVRVPAFEFPAGEVIRAALMMVACNIPAVRKTSGFTALRSKIGRKFAFMKADEWKSWVLVYSPLVLNITFDDINTAHRHLEQFCEKCNKIYTATILTCNMHLNPRFRETILDFGPVYSYWLFIFERYNDLLKNISTNGKDNSSETTRIIIIGNEPLPSTSFTLSVSKPSSMGDIDYPYLLQYYKLAYLTPDLVHYQSSAASLFFANDQIIKLESINNIGQVY